MRPGRPEDLELLIRRWRADASAGIRQFVGRSWLQLVTAQVDWATDVRVIEEAGGGAGLVVVMSRETAAGTVTRIEASSDSGALLPLWEWGLAFSRAAGAVSSQVWCREGGGQDLRRLGLSPVRPFWRMDRTHLEEIPEVPPAAGYLIADQDSQPRPSQEWVDTFNRAFERHYNHEPMTPEQFEKRHLAHPELVLMASTSDGEPAALVWGALEELFPEDPRRGPLGVVAVVGTLPEHRRRGLAAQLTAECLRRLRVAGARSACLHVDGLNADRAYDVYRRLGFEIAFRQEVWEIEMGKNLPVPPHDPTSLFP